MTRCVTPTKKNNKTEMHTFCVLLSRNDDVIRRGEENRKWGVVFVTYCCHPHNISSCLNAKVLLYLVFLTRLSLSCNIWDLSYMIRMRILVQEKGENNVLSLVVFSLVSLFFPSARFWLIPLLIHLFILSSLSPSFFFIDILMSWFPRHHHLPPFFFLPLCSVGFTLCLWILRENEEEAEFKVSCVAPSPSLSLDSGSGSKPSLQFSACSSITYPASPLLLPLDVFAFFLRPWL